MTKEIGLWINKRRAVIVINDDQEETIKRIASKIQRYEGNLNDVSGPHNNGTAEEQGKRLANQLNKYYQRVISYLRDATSILILGPGKAKAELEKRLEAQGLSQLIVAIKTAEKMTSDQVIAEVRQYFRQS